MKFAALRNQIALLRAELRSAHKVRIRITGGLPKGFKMPAAELPGGDLKRQHELFVPKAKKSSVA